MTGPTTAVGGAGRAGRAPDAAALGPALIDGPLHPGCFVYAGPRYGVAKYEGEVGGAARTRLFHSIARSQEAFLDPRGLRRIALHPQTRVYLRDEEGGWAMGRVAHFSRGVGGRCEYDVSLPNGGVAYRDETRLEARCWAHAPDPGEALAAGAGETQYFYDRRIALCAELLRFRAAGRGLAGLLSANVRLIRHQVDAVRRILEDPVQRYLLADEVGMDKTIEAGAVVRQRLIDDPAATAAIFVPEALVGQWREEVGGRFGAAAFGDRFSVYGHGALAALVAPPFAPGMIVIDEVHRVLGGAVDDAAYARLAASVRASPGLLLLSATPALGDDMTLLRILHLLDPIAYRLDRPEEFAEKSARRQEYGRALLGLRPGLSGPILRRAVASLGSLFPGDGFVAESAAAVRTEAEAGRQDGVDRAVAALRAHIAETYRLHRRLVRNRRETVQGWEFAAGVRKGAAPWLREECDEDGRLPGLCDLLEQWRLSSHQAWPGEADPSRRAAIETSSAAYLDLFEALGRGVADLVERLSRRRREVRLRGPAFPEEAAVLEAMEAVAGEGAGPRDASHVVADSLAAMRAAHLRASPKRGFKALVFAGSAERVAEVVARLGSSFGPGAVASFDGTDAGDAVKAAADRFRDDRSVEVLVCDRAGEEGHNFHFAQALVHADLPLSPARIEQRLGRLDRLGRREGTIRQRVLLPPDDREDSPYSAWFRLLVEGFGVFDGSISDVQPLLERVEPELRRALYVGGAEGLLGLVPDLRSRMARERTAIEEQYALDQLAASEEEDASMVFDALEEVEADEDVLARGVDGWLAGALRLARVPSGTSDPTFAYEWHKGVLAPAWPWREQLADPLGRRLTFDRERAADDPGVCLLRPGSGLLDAVDRFLRWDDRGTAFATWRYDPGLPAERGLEWVGLRASLTFEADLPDPAGGDAADAALRRRGDGLFPPFLATVWMDARLRAVDDPRLLAILERPYRPHADDGLAGRDFNLGSRSAALASVLDEGVRIELCNAALRGAVALLDADPRHRERLGRIARGAAKRLDGADERLRRRQDALEREGSPGDLGAMIGINRRLLGAVTSPRIRLEALGLYVLAGRPPLKGAA